jgi:beta-xylosidase
LSARAPTRPDRGRATTPRRRVAQLGLATTVVLAGVAWPARAEPAPTITARPATPPTSTSVAGADPPPETEPRADHPPHTLPRPLQPAPPPDRRDSPDPFVLANGGGYVLYSTQVGYLNVPVATSPDLRHWSPPRDALPQLPAWAAWGHTWAPGVMQLDGRYMLYFTARHQSSGRQCIGVATSPTASGPFISRATVPLVCQTQLGGSIDPYPFVDRNGTAYLLWKADSNAIGQPSTIYAQRLTPDGLALTGQPAALLTSDTAWEQSLIENPALVATGRSHLLLYSGGWWESAGYAIGYATCNGPLGPCTKTTDDRPLLASAGDQAGPGGASVVAGPAGDHWLAYHAWRARAIGYTSGGTRSLHFASLTWPNRHPAITRRRRPARTRRQGRPGSHAPTMRCHASNGVCGAEPRRDPSD